MSNEEEWRTLLAPPRCAVDLDAWFVGVASRLLNGCCLVAGGLSHRIVEIEFYFHSMYHPDPFTHCDPIQFNAGLWYFHRSHGAYRSGSFKGLDLTCGGQGSSGGVLIRGLVTPSGRLVTGPSLCMDYLLALVDEGSVASLDVGIAGRFAWDAGSPMCLRVQDAAESDAIYRTARVGLSLKRHAPDSVASRFILRPYRFLTDPRRTKWGRVHLILSLHRRGLSSAEICSVTGSPRATVMRYIIYYEMGQRDEDLTAFHGKTLLPHDLCRLHGTLAALGLG